MVDAISDADLMQIGVALDGIEVVEVASARYAVRVRVNFSHAGTASHGRYELGVWPDGGRLQIFSSQQLE